MTPDLRQHFGAPRDAGVFVGSVEADSPAAKAGLQVGDIVTKVDGDVIGSTRELVRLVRHRKGGESITVDVLRNKAAKTLTVTVAERKGSEVRIGALPEERHGHDGDLELEVLRDASGPPARLRAASRRAREEAPRARGPSARALILIQHPRRQGGVRERLRRVPNPRARARPGAQPLRHDQPRRRHDHRVGHLPRSFGGRPLRAHSRLDVRGLDHRRRADAPRRPFARGARGRDPRSRRHLHVHLARLRTPLGIPVRMDAVHRRDLGLDRDARRRVPDLPRRVRASEPDDDEDRRRRRDRRPDVDQRHRRQERRARRQRPHRAESRRPRRDGRGDLHPPGSDEGTGRGVGRRRAAASGGAGPGRPRSASPSSPCSGPTKAGTT